MRASPIKLTEIIASSGPQEFTREEIRGQEDLFSERAALFYTPTEEIPDEWVGEGPFDVILPIATPSDFEFLQTRYYQTPRFWVDLLQRATGKLRWMPMHPVNIQIVRYDNRKMGEMACFGAKALVDALKIRTSGRSDGVWLHYFGVIIDDSPSHIFHYNFTQELTSYPSEGKTRVIIQPNRI